MQHNTHGKIITLILTFEEVELPSRRQETVSKIDNGLSPATILIGRKRFIATRIKPSNIPSFATLLA